MKYKAEELKKITKVKCDEFRNKKNAKKNLEYEEFLKTESFKEDVLVVEKAIEKTLEKEEPCVVWIENDELSRAGFVSRYLREQGFRTDYSSFGRVVFYLN